MDRRSLLGDEEATLNVFGDEHEEEFEVADGFRPTQQPARRDDFGAGEETVQHAPASTAPINQRNSIRKSQSTPNPFSSPEDVEDGDDLEFEPDEVFARTHSIRFSHSIGGPSSRTATSTAAVPAPQHPYALYPQGIDDDDHEDDDEDIDLVQRNPVPVGFAGVGNSYRRQVGPDGEEQDIIGSDGHAEQLPPYSRYPEDGPEKMPLLPTALHSRAPVHGTDPGMALMHAALQPSPSAQSMTDASELEPLQSTSELALLPSHASRSLSEYGEKSTSRKSYWKERMNRRVCGIRLWWILAILGAVLFVLALVGGVAGGYLAGQRSKLANPPPSYGPTTVKQNGYPVVTVVTSLYDASLIPTPTAGAPPTGVFALTLSTPAEVQSECLVSEDERISWDCNIVPNNELAINVTMVDGSLGAHILYASDDKGIVYGAQAQSMLTPFAQFLAVKDNDLPDSGPAYYFAATYDKVVVIPEDAINATLGKFKPHFNPTLNHKDTIAPGSFPWFCVWNDTLLEGFIYIEKQSKNGLMNGVSSSPSTTQTTQASYPQPSYFTTTASFGPGASATFTGPYGDFPSWASAHRAQATNRSGGGVNNSGNQKRQATSDVWSQYAKYPFGIKLEERRMPGSDDSLQAYCQQYQVLWDHQANWKPTSRGDPIKVWLDEQDPTYSAYKSTGIAVGERKQRRGDVVSSGCHCQWTSGL